MSSLLIFVGYNICQQAIISSILTDENFHWVIVSFWLYKLLWEMSLGSSKSFKWEKRALNISTEARKKIKNFLSNIFV